MARLVTPTRRVLYHGPIWTATVENATRGLATASVNAKDGAFEAAVTLEWMPEHSQPTLHVALTRPKTRRKG